MERSFLCVLRAEFRHVWLLLGFPGLDWATGLSSVWVIVGAGGGAIFQRVIYSKPFMDGQKETGTVILMGLLAEKLPALITFVFFMGYVGLHFIADSNIFQNAFSVSATVGLVVVALLIVLYLFAGGFLAIVWTDAMQALLMIFTLVMFPGLHLVQIVSDPPLSIMGTLKASGNGRASWFGGKTGSAALLLLGTNLSWFFATLGSYPHLDV